MTCFCGNHTKNSKVCSLPDLLLWEKNATDHCMDLLYVHTKEKNRLSHF